MKNVLAMNNGSLNIRKACLEDINKIVDIYSVARQFMKDSGNPNQWYNHYPPIEIIESDIKNENLYVVFGEEIYAVFMMDCGPDDTYSIIKDGNWLNDKPYGVIHRIASNGKIKGVLGYCIEFCKKYYDNIRIDTHNDNKVMQHLLEKYGFCRCGTIFLANGEPRIAYQFSLNGEKNEEKT